MRGVYERVHDYRVRGRRREEGGKAMRVGVESCISMSTCMNFSYSPTILKATRSLARKSISPPLGREHDAGKKCNTRRCVILDSTLKIKDEIFCLT